MNRKCHNHTPQPLETPFNAFANRADPDRQLMEILGFGNPSYSTVKL